MAIRAKRERFVKVTKEARIDEMNVLEPGDMVLLLREDEIPNITAEDAGKLDNAEGVAAVEAAADDASNPKQEKVTLGTLRKRAEAAKKRYEAARRKMREDMVIDEENENPFVEGDDAEIEIKEEDEEEKADDKVEERYQRILRRREAARRLSMRSKRESVVTPRRSLTLRAPLSRVSESASDVARRARLVRARREAARRRFGF